MKSEIPAEDVLRIVDFVTTFQVSCPDYRTVLCREIVTTFPPETASIALWIVRVLGTSNTLAQVVELYGMCLNNGSLPVISTLELTYLKDNTQETVR